MNRTFLSEIKNMSRVYKKNIDRLPYDIVRNYLPIAIIVAINLFLNSCAKPVEEITWDIKNHPPMLVVDGRVTNQLKNQSIQLTLSSTYNSAADPEPVNNASVHINDGSTNYDFTESADSAGWYFSNEPFSGVPGKTYNLFITLNENINGQKEYTSFSTMPEGLDIDSIQCSIYSLPEEFITNNNDNEIKDTTILVIIYFGNEPISPGNYYYANILKNNLPLMSGIKNYPFTDDSERNGAYINFMGLIKNVADHDTITFDLFSINRAYFKYIDAISKIDQTGDIYSPSGPPANALGNVDGALGYFIATYVSTGVSLAVRGE